MLLSVIIVNYNVKYFLEQCLASVKKAMEQGVGSISGQGDNNQALDSADQHPATASIEVLVVDNQSTDGSLEYLQPRFPFVRFIANTANTGFASANNLALGQSRGKYILFLNPDTIVPEDCFQQCFAFMEAHPQAGALGVHMIDGSGEYLPESKRGFPSPWVSFCKMTGLTRLFPTSRIFAQYYQGHLPASQTQEAAVLSGAFMWVRKETLDKTGGFDERFFMYAEDIDLSYRIQKAGYTNYYYADTTIIHFKGESTRKDARYVKQFYTAMIQFVEKHFNGLGAWGYISLLKAMIWWKRRNADKETERSAASSIDSLHFTGDAASIAEMAAFNKTTTAASQLAYPLVICIGATFPFKDAIQLFQQQKAPIMFLHAQHTGSAVTSSHKTSQGNHLIL